MAPIKGFLAVRVTKTYRTVREIRPDATACAECGAVGRTLYDYENSPLTKPPAFCNKDCWMGYRLKDNLRLPTAVDEAPVSKQKHADRRKPRKRQPPGKKRPVTHGHLSAVS
ncbi:hypothetical protein IPM44_03445 [bacterium]|nr:MAG: hypothetical protein IPM44_03445 [bacterium]